MADIFNKTKRSSVMSKVGRKNTPIEIIVRKFLFSKGFRYRINYKKLPGSPDIVLPKYKIAVFIHGCFWHGHNCRAGKLPTSNVSFWKQKIKANRTRDKRFERELIDKDWHVITIWSCTLKTKKIREETLEKLLLQLKN